MDSPNADQLARGGWWVTTHGSDHPDIYPDDPPKGTVVRVTGLSSGYSQLVWGVTVPGFAPRRWLYPSWALRPATPEEAASAQLEAGGL